MGVQGRKNVIIVGAGASKEFNLPTGEELKKLIQQKLSYKYDRRTHSRVGGDSTIREAILRISKLEKNSLSYTDCLEIAGNMDRAPSIDNFLHTHKQNHALVRCGKLAIAKCIIEAEGNSLLAYKRENDGDLRVNSSRLNSTWLAKLFKIIVSD